MSYLYPEYHDGMSWRTLNPNHILEMLEGGLEDAVPGVFSLFKRVCFFCLEEG